MRSAFAEFKDSAFAQKALLKYDKTPFSYAFDGAKNKDQEAIVYFTLKSLGPIYSAFNNFYVRGRNIDAMEKSHDFFNEYFARLLSQTEEDTGPFFHFDPTKFQPEQQADDEFLLNKLRYYMFRYATALATNLYKKENKRTRNETDIMDVPDEQEDVSSTNPLENIASKEKSAEEKISGDMIYNNKPFMDYLEQKFPKWYKFMHLLHDYSKYDDAPVRVSKKMGWTIDNGVGGKIRSTPSGFNYGKNFVANKYKDFIATNGAMTPRKKKKHPTN